MVDDRSFDASRLVEALRACNRLPRRLPNEARVCSVLAGRERLAGAILPATLGPDALAALVRTARQARPKLPILVLAGAAQEADALEASLRRTGVLDAGTRVAAPGSELPLDRLLAEWLQARAPERSLATA